MDDIRVSIAITTYNLQDYIAECLDSILSQKTTFKYKVIIADDCSTDNTLQILNEYKSKYPDIITILTADNNLGSLKNSNMIFANINTEYFTFIDGDDYWLNDNRLQMQVDFLDSHQAYILCGANNKRLIDGSRLEDEVEKKYLGKSYFFEDYVNRTMPFFHTSTILCRNVVFNKGLPSIYKEVEDTFENCALRGEDFRRLLHLQKGPLFAFDEDFSVYRIHSKGMWSGKSRLRGLIENAISYHYYLKYFGGGYGVNLSKKFRNIFIDLACTLIKNNFSHSTYSDKDYSLIRDFLDDVYRNYSVNPGLYKFTPVKFINSLIINVVTKSNYVFKRL